MRTHLHAFYILAGLGLSFSVSNAAFACPQPSVSAGIRLTITKAYPRQNAVDIQFLLTNETNARIYLKDAQREASQRGFLASGEQLEWPRTIGVEVCDGALSQCVRDDFSPDVRNINSYSYIEPHESLSGSFSYRTKTSAGETDLISFSVPLAVRFTQPNGDPYSAGPARPVRFNFTSVQLNCR